MKKRNIVIIVSHKQTLESIWENEYSVKLSGEGNSDRKNLYIEKPDLIITSGHLYTKEYKTLQEKFDSENDSVNELGVPSSFWDSFNSIQLNCFIKPLCEAVLKVIREKEVTLLVFRDVSDLRLFEKHFIETNPEFKLEPYKKGHKLGVNKLVLK